MRRFIMWVVLLVTLLIVSLVAVSVSVARFAARVEVWPYTLTTVQRGPLFITARFTAPPSIWRRFVRIESVTVKGTLYESVNAWLTDPPDPNIGIRNPVPVDGPYDVWPYDGKKPTQLPLQGATPPLNVLIEIHPVRAWDGTTYAWRFTAYYRLLFLRLHTTWDYIDTRRWR